MPEDELPKQPLTSFADRVAIAAVLFVAIGAGCYSWPLSLIVIGVAMLAGWWMTLGTDDEAEKEPDEQQFRDLR